MWSKPSPNIIFEENPKSWPPSLRPADEFLWVTACLSRGAWAEHCRNPTTRTSQYISSDWNRREKKRKNSANPDWSDKEIFSVNWVTSQLEINHQDLWPLKQVIRVYHDLIISYHQPMISLFKLKIVMSLLGCFDMFSFIYTFSNFCTILLSVKSRCAFNKVITLYKVEMLKSEMKFFNLCFYLDLSKIFFMNKKNCIIFGCQGPEIFKLKLNIIISTLVEINLLPCKLFR